MNKPEKQLKENRKFIEDQRQFFGSPGNILEELLNISKKHPVISITFLISFSLFVNGLFEIIMIFLPSNHTRITDLKTLTIINVVLLFILFVLFIKTKWTKRDLFKQLPLNERKALITIASKHDDGFKHTTSYAFYEAMLYHKGEVAKTNAIEKVYIIVSEDEEVRSLAEDMAQAIRKQHRDAEVLPVKINGLSHNVEDIKRQLKVYFDQNVLKEYKAHEIIADYTGGTKELGVALYLNCLDYFILPVYLDVKKSTRTGQVPT